jgi:hypothetical protein
VAQVGSITANTLLGLLCSSSGLPSAVAEVSMRENTALPEIGEEQMFAQNVSSDLAEKGQAFRYPAVYVYCDKTANLLREKFRKFSGTARLNVEIRISHNRMEELDRDLQLYVDAVTEVLHRNYGDWGQGISYSGGYEVQFGAVKQGGKNYVQTAKVVLKVDVSQS